jgi:Putative beta-barrel porin-2, OmpL-like. bbp2
LSIRLKCVFAFSTAALLAVSAFGQDAPAQAPAPAAAPAAAPPPWSVGPIDFSGLIDGYYSFNFNHPASQVNGLYNFDTAANQFSLNMAKLSMSHSADPIGFQVDFGFGHAFDMINGIDNNGLRTKNIEQAYVSWKPKGKDSGFQMDFGKFVTSAGAEVIESNANWNYSRSLLFSWAIPYYHFGFRATETKGHFTGGFQLVNGWNNVEDNNSGKTLGFVGNFTSKKLSWNNNYYTGPENPTTNTGWRNLYDTTVLFTPADKFNAYVNFDYGQNKSGSGSSAVTAKWYGVAFAGKLQMNDHNAITPRYDWFKDRDNFLGTGMVCVTGKECDALQEFTLTYEYKWTKGLLARLEYRRDWTTLAQPTIFQRGSTGARDHQDTLALGIVAFFGPH